MGINTVLFVKETFPCQVWWMFFAVWAFELISTSFRVKCGRLSSKNEHGKENARNKKSKKNSCFTYWHEFLIHEADPQSRPKLITIFTRGVCPSVKIPQNKKQFQVRIVPIGWTVGLANWIINDTSFFFVLIAKSVRPVTYHMKSLKIESMTVK